MMLTAGNDVSCEGPSCMMHDLPPILQRAIEISDQSRQAASLRSSTNGGGALGVASLAQALRSFHEEEEGGRKGDVTGCY